MGDSSFVWDEMDMNAVSLDFEQLFPEFSFDGKAVFGHVMQGELWEALKMLGGGIADAFAYQRGVEDIVFHNPHPGNRGGAVL